MHRQNWALLLPLGPQHTSAHLGCWDGAGRSTRGRLLDGALAHPRDFRMHTHSRPIPLLGPMNPYRLHKTPQQLLPWDTPCCRTAHLLHQGFLDTATFLDPGRTLGIIKLQKGLHEVEENQGCISLSLFLTREGFTVDPVSLKSRSEEGGWDCHNLGAYIPALLEIETRGKQLGHYHSHSLTRGFPASSQVPSCNGTARNQLRSKQAVAIPPGPHGAHQAVPSPLQGMMGRRGASASQHSPGSQGDSLPDPFPFAAISKSLEKEHLGPSALCSKMHQSVQT